MLGSIYIGLSGMNAFSKGLQSISNNVANLNTPGFKATKVRFSDVFSSGGGGLTYQQGSMAQQSGGGVRLAPPTIDFSQGDLRESEGDLDLAIQGSGFLTLIDGDRVLYARTGQFVVDEEGYITLQGTNMRLGVLNKDREVTALTVDEKRTSKPIATTKITFAGDLSSGAADATVSNISVIDSSGGKHAWKVKFTSQATTTPGQWKVEVFDENDTVIKTSALKFIGTTIDLSTAQIAVSASPAGADPLSVTLDLSKGVTSFANGTTSTLRASTVDGNGVGALTGVTVDDAGQVKLAYSNGKSDLQGAVAIADFRDPQNLVRIGNGLFEDRGHGQVRLLESGAEGVGKLVSKQVEASNVNLSDEFGDLILIQRGFQASSQVVSIANDMIQNLFGIRGQG